MLTSYCDYEKQMRTLNGHAVVNLVININSLKSNAQFSEYLIDRTSQNFRFVICNLFSV